MRAAGRVIRGDLRAASTPLQVQVQQQQQRRDPAAFRQLPVPGVVLPGQNEDLWRQLEAVTAMQGTIRPLLVLRGSRSSRTELLESVNEIHK